MGSGLRIRARTGICLASVAWLLAAPPGCDRGTAPANTGHAPADSGHEERLEEAAAPRCFSGELAVEEEHRFAPAPEGCERTPSLRWTGRATWVLRQESPRTTAWLLPRSELRTVRVAWEIAQTGFEEHCLLPDPARDLTGREWIRSGRIVRAVAREGVHVPGDPALAGALYHRPPPLESPSGRPVPEPRLSPDRLRPGQYELTLPAPCHTFEAEGTRYDGPAKLPAPHGVRCDFGLPVWIEFRPGHTRTEHERTCADEPRFIEDDVRLHGERRCEIEDRDGRASVLSARWDLRATPCDELGLE
jgi:hypothetical protein